MYENFPYSNFHDLNTDWIIDRVKNVETSEANAKASEENAKASEQNAKVSELSAQGFALQANNHAQYAREQAQAAAQSATEANNYVSSTREQVNLLQSRVDNIIPNQTQTEGNTELLDIRVAENGQIYDSAGNSVRGQVRNLKNALISNVSKKIKVEQGYWAILDGTATNSSAWCRTSNFVDKEAVFVTTNIQMYILAFDAVSGTYVGAWNGTEFSTTYNVNSFVNEIVFKEWLDKYPNYSFKVNFRKNGENFTPTDVLSDLQIIDYNFSEIDFIESAMLESDVTGECRLNPYSFTRGTLTEGNLFPSYKYRVSMIEIKSYPYDVNIIAKTGFRISINLYTNGTYTGYAGWTTNYTISKNQQFRIMIARTTDNTTEIADINEFVGNVYIKSLSLKKEESFETNGNFGNALTSNNRYIYHFGMEYVTERTETPPTIPAQSIYDVRNAKNLGFWCIECNVHKTSDGKYVVTHGVQGKLGHDFDDLNGNDAGEQNVIISQNTLSDLQANYRYRSSNPAYRVPITTLENFLAECSRVNINVMQMYNDTTSMNIGINIMGGHRIWFYSAPRSVYSGAITNWRKLTTKAEIIADCESYGLPYVYSMGNPEAFSDSELKDIAETLHSMGYQLMTAYQTNNTMNKLASFGWDYFILGNNSFREPVIINGKRINFNQDGSVTWTTVEL